MTFNFVRVCDQAEAAVKQTISTAVIIDVFIVGPRYGGGGELSRTLSARLDRYVFKRYRVASGESAGSDWIIKEQPNGHPFYRRLYLRRRPL